MLTNVINYLSAGWTSVKPGGGSRCASGRGPGAAADIIFKASRKKDGGSGAKSENRMVIDERQRSECVPVRRYQVAQLRTGIQNPKRSWIVARG
ncbi:hypothetical protein PGT21_009436 [Puccinia graminis f. sp. tritici]|uniref:Uncharacterized protein n=1 Tax=Puccinia graminis f. sp. tritici TaxID=56615 RepID=A0A5B0NIP0_PUCGR|nr:hypothetical protein PGT21_009436 [Puccinia graminis f. sp. tritici]